MKRATALTLLLLHCFTLTADAATRYVNRSTGNDSDTGATGHAWRTIAKVNATLAGGETCIAAANDTIYDAAFVPLNDGTTLLGDSTNWNLVRIPGVQAVAKFTNANGLRIEGSVIGSAKYLHVRNCRIRNNVTDFYGGLTMIANQIGTNEGTSQFYIQPNATEPGDSCVIKNNGMALRFLGTLGSDHLLHWQPDVAVTGTIRASMKDWVVSANRCTLTMAAGQQFEKTMFIGRLRRSLISDNLFKFRDSVGTIANCGNQTFVVRDSCKLLVFLRDTIDFEACNGPSGASRALFYSVGNGSPNSSNAIRWCTFRSNVMPCSEASFWQEWRYGDRDSVYRNVYTCEHGGDCVKIDGAGADTSFFERNTIAQLGPGRPIKIEPDDKCGVTAWAGNLRARGNLIYSRGNETAYVLSRPALPATVTSDYNLLFGTAFTRSKAIKYAYCGFNPAWFAAPMAAVYGQDAHSRWGSPMFEDSIYATFNPALGYGSAAGGVGPDGTDAGAYDYVAAKPSQITDLRLGGATNSRVLLLFTAPGANGMTGTASDYDVRYSTGEITESNFTNATQFSTASPQVYGTAEAVLVTGLAAATSYHFAIRASNGSRVGLVSADLAGRTWPTNAIDP